MVHEMKDLLSLISTRLEVDASVLYGGIAGVAAMLAVHVWWLKPHRDFQQSYGEATYRPAFHPLTALGVVFGRGLEFTWDQRFTLYRKIPRELISLEPRFWGKPVMYTNSSEVMRQISANSPWGKPQWSQSASGYWGRSVLTSNGAEWRKHRKIVQPAFNSDLYEMVWKETSRFFNEMVMHDQWPVVSGETKAVPRAQSFTQRVALCVILSCAFGIPISWNSNTDGEDDKFSLEDGIKFQGENATLLGHAPSWIFRIPTKRFQYIRKCSTAMRSWFNNSITSKKAELSKVLDETNGDMDDAALKKDVFSRIILTSQSDSKLYLDDSEIMGNTWVMFFAGHDTTAKGLAATFCLLALHKDEQDVIVTEIQGLTEENADGTLGFKQYDLLIKTRGAFIEALRLYPPGSIMLRETTENTVLQVPCGTRGDGDLIEAVHIPKGTLIVGDMIGIQYNPRSFPQPESFRPSRWYSAHTEEAFTAFSSGPRGCVGKRFALIEAVCFLAHVLGLYEVQPLLENGEDIDGWRARVLGRTELKLTLGIVDSPLVFRRR